MQRILVLGAGFAGLWSAIGAARALDESGVAPDPVEMIVVNATPWHSIRVRNYEADLSVTRLPLADLLEPIGVKLVVAEVTGLAIAGRTVTCAAAGKSFRLDYDRLSLPSVVAMGRFAGHNVVCYLLGEPMLALSIAWYTPELCLQFRYFALRKLHFALRAKALVVFPGGFGTMDELFEILELSQTRKMPPVPVILVGEEYWRRAFDADFLVEEGVIDAEDRELFWFAESAESIWSNILRWHELQGVPLLAPKGALL